MARCRSITRRISNAGRTLSTSRSKLRLSKAGRILKAHQDKKH